MVKTLWTANFDWNILEGNGILHMIPTKIISKDLNHDNHYLTISLKSIGKTIFSSKIDS